MALFLKYVKEKRVIIALYVLFCVIFGVVFALYHLLMQAALYPALHCAMVGAVAILLDFVRVKHRHAELGRMTSLFASMIGELPDADSIENEDYQAIIRALQVEAAETAAVSASRYRDMVDYYTLWVHQIKTPIASMRLTMQNADSPEIRKLQADLFRSGSVKRNSDFIIFWEWENLHSRKFCFGNRSMSR